MATTPWKTKGQTMKRMIDKSIMSGVKILGELKLVSQGMFWNIYLENNDSYVYVISMKKLKKESNISLYNAAKQAVERNT